MVFHQQYHYSLFDRHSGTWIHPAAKIAASSDPPGPCPHGEKSKVHEQSPVEKHRKARDNGIHIPHKEYGMTCWNWWISRRDMVDEIKRTIGGQVNYDWRKTSTDSQKLVEAVRPKAMKYHYNHRIYKPSPNLQTNSTAIMSRNTWDNNSTNLGPKCFFESFFRRTPPFELILYRKCTLILWYLWW